MKFEISGCAARTLSRSRVLWAVVRSKRSAHGRQLGFGKILIPGKKKFEGERTNGEGGGLLFETKDMPTWKRKRFKPGIE